MGIIYGPPNQVYFIDHFNNALGKLPFQSNEIYLLGDFNINFFKVITSSKNKEAQFKNRLLQPCVETSLAFGLNQLTEKPTRFTLHTVSLTNHILTNSK